MKGILLTLRNLILIWCAGYIINLVVSLINESSAFKSYYPWTIGVYVIFYGLALWAYIAYRHSKKVRQYVEPYFTAQGQQFISERPLTLWEHINNITFEFGNVTFNGMPLVSNKDEFKRVLTIETKAGSKFNIIAIITINFDNRVDILELETIRLMT